MTNFYIALILVALVVGVAYFVSAPLAVSLTAFLVIIYKLTH